MSDWKKIISQIAPTIATALGGPLAGVAVQALGASFGMTEPTEESLQARLSGATPEDLLKIKEAEQKFIIDMKRAEIDIMRIDSEDRDSARKRESSVGSKMNNTLVFFISLLATVSTMGVFYLFFNDKFASLSAMEASIVTLVIREVYEKLGQVCNYCFGSSLGSTMKTDLLAKAQPIK